MSGHHITTIFCIWLSIIAIVSYADFYSDRFVKMWMSQNKIYQIWNVSFVREIDHRLTEAKLHFSLMP